MPALTSGRVRLVAAAWAVVLLLVLAGLATVVNRGTLHFSDNLLLLAAQAPAGAVMDWLMALVSLVGSVEVTSLLMLLLVLTTRGLPRLSWERFLPLAVFVLVTAIEVAGKSLVHQPAPPASLLRGPQLPGLGVGTAYAFPSGHMTRVTMVFGLYGLRLFRRSANPLWPWAGVAAVWIVGYSRVYLGEHWPADVAGGILLGGIGLALCLAISPRASVGALDGDVYAVERV